MILDTIGRIFCILFACFIIFLLTAPIIRITISSMSSAKDVKATVIKKYVAQSFSKYAGNGVNEKYMVVFSANGKTKRFQVSQFSYNGYNVNEEGLLTYKGNMLISFK